ncbi:PH (Pleckstrin Homology) domain-containing protein [Knoellia remsis]|uniref:PH (Pleckstrin Homology) domain-containing protein n=1 Tax=Knoellia remsis TaxID=407159 RepID=A0A2T0U686_9MICO|nr:PH domain-containing protein [Knoellia remsis]PRY53392.1 PH (Pleckstrin Homology) domain-containing protein [Knoellia remsis]
MPLGRVDKELERYLVPGEEVVAVVRQHWFSQIRPILAFVGLLFLATFVEAEAPRTQGGAIIANIFWWAAFGGAGYLLWRYLNWRHDWFVATDKRFLLFYGFIRRKVAMMPLTKVTDMTFDRSIMGRIIGYGTFLLESAGQDQALGHIEYVPNADRHYRAICTVLFGSDAPVDPDDDWDDGDDGWDDEGPGGYGPGDGDPRGRDPRDPRDTWDDGWQDGWEDPHGWREHLARGRGGRGDGRGRRGDDGTGADGIRNPVRERRPAPPPHRTLYRSADLVEASRLEDTGEIPVIRPRTRRRGRGLR